VAYRDLLRALEEEVREQARALKESARAEGERLAAEARRLAEAAREDALARATAERASAAQRARVRAALDEERLLLGEKRRILEELRGEARSRLPGLSSLALSRRLLDEALGDDDGSPLRVVADPGHAEACREHLASHPETRGRVEVVEAAQARGGVELEVGDHLSVDNTLPSRLFRAWPALEVELASILFGGADDAR